MFGGYANRVAWVDLTAGAVDYKEIDERDARMYVGGRGLGVKYVFDNGPQVEPLSPDNILCVMVGPLTGTQTRMSGRLCTVTKSPLTGTVTDSHMGGWTAAHLKWAGFDGLVFKGKAETPVYAYVEGGTVTLHDASDLWGTGVHETIQRMRDKHGQNVEVMAIGPAGENLVRFACWINSDDRASGRGGSGAVAGSKNLKCIVIKGDRKNVPRPVDPAAFSQANDDCLAKLKACETTNPRDGDLHLYGTNVLANMLNEIGGYPSRNAQHTVFAATDAVSGETIADTILVKRPTCWACPVACKKEVEIKTGKHQGLHMESMEYEPVWSFGSMCEIDDPAAIAALIDRCNDLGLDAIESGDGVAMTMEATQKGLVDGPAWGDSDAALALVGSIALRQGLGADLAEGMDPCSKKWGDTGIAMTVKGQSIPAYDPRAVQGMGIGYATSNRGACHLRGYTPAAEVVFWVLGERTKADPLAWQGKAQLQMIFQNVYGFTDSLNVCKFGTFAIPLAVYAALYASVTGVPLDVGGLLKIGERVYNLERYYNNLAGLREGSDSLPERFLKEPAEGPAAGSVCHLDEMLQDYYTLRGWEDGVVTEAKLIELGII